MNWIMIRHCVGRSKTKGMQFSQMDWVSPEKNSAGFHKEIVFNGDTFRLHHSDQEFAHYKLSETSNVSS